MIIAIVIIVIKIVSTKGEFSTEEQIILDGYEKYINDIKKDNLRESTPVEKDHITSKIKYLREDLRNYKRSIGKERFKTRHNKKVA